MGPPEALEQPAWSCPDDESLDLILSLLREDAQQVKSTSKGKQREGTLSDADIALRLYTEELSRATTYASDRRMTRSIQDALGADTTALIEFERMENAAKHDRDIAVASSTGRPHNRIQVPDIKPSAADLETFEKLEAIFVTGIDVADEGDEVLQNDTESDIGMQPESSSWAASRRPKKVVRRPCVACGEMNRFIDLARAPCQHEYCRECLNSLFQHAMLDESLFPPRCCRQIIPVDANRFFLGSDLAEQFKKKAVELSTPNRNYCHRPTCSAFIPPSRVENGVAWCPQCNTPTCITCKGAAHQGDCPSDTELQRVLEVARQERWQRCPECRTMVELNVGCFHIRCKCRAEFCYNCGVKWKNCQCAQWDEQRLYNRAEQILNRGHNQGEGNRGAGAANLQPARLPELRAAEQVMRLFEPQPARPANAQPAGPSDPQPTRPANAQSTNAQPVSPEADREVHIERIMEHLRQNHECDHERWISRKRRAECEECHDVMPLFIYECRQCSILACRRCRYNRL
ncbi:hypothetical protein F4825DRAFT_468172 [Nemania diffusa]|nr:hypothetical protein F4825DRAFT_468172 [Nemania diffusa]